LSALETIAAIATAPGLGGIGVVRISGTRAGEICRQLTGQIPQPRQACFLPFLSEEQEELDAGIVLHFPAPHSFTGEDVVEFQGHGGPVVLDMVLRRITRLGARLARPGEFSERAFLNGKLDLAQAEAIADLIEAETETAARMAGRTLQGRFSDKIHDLVEQLIDLRLFVEASIDFPEEEIDFLSDSKVSTELRKTADSLEAVMSAAMTGQLLRDGMNLVIAGRPNAGKSSLLNALSGCNTAIVTSIPGTTRDPLRERIQLDGMPLHVIDTAGLRESADPVELEGIKRAKHEIDQADRVLWIFEDSVETVEPIVDREHLPSKTPLILVRNKIDLTGRASGLRVNNEIVEISLSVKSGEGLDLLKSHLKECMGYSSGTEGEFIARRRHLDALERARENLRLAEVALYESAAELLAEDLRQAQQALSEITGEFSPDDLLGRIFSTFCIGK
jgi:tRNA modification GTPase